MRKNGISLSTLSADPAGLVSVTAGPVGSGARIAETGSEKEHLQLD